MTSDMAKQSVAQENLEFALGERRVSLSQLTGDEFDRFLVDAFRDVDLHHLRGFQPLKDIVTKSPGSFVPGKRQNPLETVVLTERTLFGSDWEKVIGMDSQVAQVSNGPTRYSVVWRRSESGEETDDPVVASGWGHEAMIRSLDEAILVLHRQPNYSRISQNLYEVRTQTKKVPHKDMMEIVQIDVNRVRISEFRKHFGSKYPKVAQGLIWQVSSIMYQTVEGLKVTLDACRNNAGRFNRIVDSITE